jgi:hypothetical protein
MGTKPGERMMGQLELWTKPGERRMGPLERRAEAISGKFNSQDIANTLWAFVTDGAEAISGEFKSKNVANSQWAFATMGTKPGERMTGKMERRAETISGEFNSQVIYVWACKILETNEFPTLYTTLYGGNTLRWVSLLLISDHEMCSLPFRYSYLSSLPVIPEGQADDGVSQQFKMPARQSSGDSCFSDSWSSSAIACLLKPARSRVCSCTWAADID